MSYRDTIAEVVSLGGDTDTNACIVGGMIGAYHGIMGLDHKMWEKLIRCDVTR